MKHPMLYGFGKWLGINFLLIMIIWIITPKWNPVFLQTLLNNFGIGYYDFFFFWWFILMIGTFVWFIILPSASKKSFLR